MWYYKNELIDSIDKVPEGAVGFIYKISKLEYNDVWYDKPQATKFYIGKKQLNSVRRTRISKREKESTNTRKTFKVTSKESDWLTYNSSCKELQDEIKKLGSENFYKEIIEWCFNKRDLNYKEVWWQFHLDVLENDTYNKNIASRWFKKKENL